GFVPITLKNPQISVDGHSSIKNSYFDGFLTGSGALDDGVNFDFYGKFKTKLTFVDQFNEHYRSGTRSNYVSYLDDVDINGSTEQPTDVLKLPGDIPDKAIKKGNDLPLIAILRSTTNIFILIVLIAVTIFVLYFLKRNNSRIVQGN